MVLYEGVINNISININNTIDVTYTQQISSGSLTYGDTIINVCLQFYVDNTLNGIIAIKTTNTMTPGTYTINMTPNDTSIFDQIKTGIVSATIILQTTGSGGNGPESAQYAIPGENNPPCFLADAPVLTPSGYKSIASLREGDLVTTADGRAVPIERVSVTRVPAPSAAVNPYVIKKGQFGATERLLISPRHRVAVPGKGMVEARELGLTQWTMRGAFDYYNLELPSWKSDNMVVAGVEVESLAPVRRIVVSAEQLKGLLAGKTLDAAFVAKLRSVIRPVAGGFEVPLMKKSAAK